LPLLTALTNPVLVNSHMLSTRLQRRVKELSPVFV
jgi:hypothetical protein